MKNSFYAIVSLNVALATLCNIIGADHVSNNPESDKKPMHFTPISTPRERLPFPPTPSRPQKKAVPSANADEQISHVDGNLNNK